MYSLNKLSTNDAKTLLNFVPSLNRSTLSFVSRNIDELLRIAYPSGQCIAHKDFHLLINPDDTTTNMNLVTIQKQYSLTCSIIEQYLKTDTVNGELFKVLYTELFKIMKMPAETVEDLKEIIRYSNELVISNVSDEYGNLKSFINNFKIISALKMWFNTFYTVLRFKFISWSEISSIMNDCKPVDMNESRFSKYPFSMLLQIFISITDELNSESWVDDTASIIHLILTELKMTSDECYLCPIFLAYCNLKELYSGEKIIKKMFSFINGSDSIIDCIHNIKFNKSFLDFHNSHIVERLVNDEKTISTSSTNHTLIFGDNLIPDHMEITDFIFLVKKIRAYFIRKYDKLADDISFVIKENDICGILYEYPNTKKCIVKDQDETKTLVEFNGTLYLLYIDNKNKKIGGISVLETNSSKGRKLITFELPNDSDYVVSCNQMN